MDFFSEPISNFPKVKCPFVRKRFAVNKSDWSVHGNKYQLRVPEVYLATSEIEAGYEWIFDDDVVAVEKLDGTNVSVRLKNGLIDRVQNRKSLIDTSVAVGNQSHITQGIYNSGQKSLLPRDGVFYGELIGPKLQGNPYKLDSHLFYPFMIAYDCLRYKSYRGSDMSFDSISSWMRDGLHSIAARKLSKSCDDVFAGGVILYKLSNSVIKKPYMAKIRRDMFPWFYDDRIRILGMID